MLSHLSSL